MDNSIEIVILAAGSGKRMKSSLVKVLHPLAAKPLLHHVLETATQLTSKTPVLVLSNENQQVIQDRLSAHAFNVAIQSIPQGTGHAMECALSQLPDQGRVLVLYGDVPLITSETLKNFISQIPTEEVGVLTAFVDNPFGLGRIIRDADGYAKAIIEQKDATEEQQKISEINTGIYCFPLNKLHNWLQKIDNNNAQNEFYLTDVIAAATASGAKVHPVVTHQSQEVLGINDRQQLAKCERLYQLRQASHLMNQGVSIFDPARLDIRGHVHAEPDVSIDTNVILEGEVTLKSGCTIGTGAYLKNVTLAENVTVLPYCVIEDAVIERNTTIGPFARIRPGTHIGEDAKVGNFVEIKKSSIAQGSKVNHLTYVGDTVMGKNVNVGAGTITCNYDGIAHKYQTTIGDDVSIGSNCSLVAPVTLKDKSFIGAGSVITRDTPAGELSLTRSHQKSLGPWPRAKANKGE